MNFPNLPGARMRDERANAFDDVDPAEVDRRLAALAAEDVVPVRQEWLDATLARATAGRATSRTSGPVRRLLAAAVAMLGLHGMVAAATIATVGAGVVVAAVVWTAERNAAATMSYASALRILGRPEQPEEHRLAALAQVLDRLRSSVTVLIEVRNAPDSPSELVAIADGYLERLRAHEVGSLPSQPPDPLGALTSARCQGPSLEERRAAVCTLGESAISCATAIRDAAMAGDSFMNARQNILRRLERMLQR